MAATTTSANTLTLHTLPAARLLLAGATSDIDNKLRETQILRVEGCYEVFLEEATKGMIKILCRTSVHKLCVLLPAFSADTVSFISQLLSAPDSSVTSVTLAETAKAAAAAEGVAAGSSSSSSSSSSPSSSSAAELAVFIMHNCFTVFSLELQLVSSPPGIILEALKENDLLFTFSLVIWKDPAPSADGLDEEKNSEPAEEVLSAETVFSLAESRDWDRFNVDIYQRGYSPDPSAGRQRFYLHPHTGYLAIIGKLFSGVDLSRFLIPRFNIGLIEFVATDMTPLQLSAACNVFKVCTGGNSGTTIKKLVMDRVVSEKETLAPMVRYLLDYNKTDEFQLQLSHSETIDSRPALEAFMENESRTKVDYWEYNSPFGGNMLSVETEFHPSPLLATGATAAADAATSAAMPAEVAPGEAEPEEGEAARPAEEIPTPASADKNNNNNGGVAGEGEDMRE